MTPSGYTEITVEDGAVSAPPQHLVRGELGEELIVLTLSVIRVAERLEQDEVIDTADGPVHGRVGDFVVTTASSERYPILASVFYGSYRIVGRVGSRFVGCRLVHARRAWPIVSAYAEFDYGPTRGKVAARRGGWIYQSDDDDFGLINADVKESAHVVVGRAADLKNCDWLARFQRASSAIAMLPPLMTLVALLAFASATRGHLMLSQSLLAIEAAGLVCGIGMVSWMRRERWAMRAAFASGAEIARRMQSAVAVLCQRPSHAFPAMALWRAAQDDTAPPPSFTRDTLRTLKDQIYETSEHVRQEMQQLHVAEARADGLSWISAAIVLGCIATAIVTHSVTFELLAIWLPSAVGAVHAWMHRRQVGARVVAGREFLSELSFVREQLVTLAPDDRVNKADAICVEALTATVRLLCRAAADHSQRQMQFAISEVPGIPL